MLCLTLMVVFDGFGDTDGNNGSIPLTKSVVEEVMYEAMETSAKKSLRGRTNSVSNLWCMVQGKSQLLPPVTPYYPFPRVKIHTRGNIWSFTVG